MASLNILQKVQTYQKYSAAYLQNYYCFVSNANKKFENFQNITGNLGSSVGFKLPDRFVKSNGLMATFGGYEQRIKNISVTQSANVSFSVTNEERIFNVDKTGEQYMKEAGASAVQEFGSGVEQDLALNAISGVVDSFIDSQTYGQKNYLSGPYRFYRTGITNGKIDPIGGYTELAKMITKFKTIGHASDIKVYLPDITIPNIIGTGLNQFTPKRSDETTMSWAIGKYGYPEVEYLQSNLLPTHIAGTVGNEAVNHTLTVVSTNDPTGNKVTEITFSGATASDLNAIKYGDLFESVDDVSGYPDLRWLTHIGHHVTTEPVQFRVIADAIAGGDTNVVVKLYSGMDGYLSSVSGRNQNINTNIVAGMKFRVMPSHRAGLIISDNALLLAMPQLPEQSPFITANAYDDDSGVSLRMTYGSKFGENQKGIIYDGIWGSLAIPEYCERILLPVNSNL